MKKIHEMVCDEIDDCKTLICLQKTHERSKNGTAVPSFASCPYYSRPYY